MADLGDVTVDQLNINLHSFLKRLNVFTPTEAGLFTRLLHAPYESCTGY